MRASLFFAGTYTALLVIGALPRPFSLPVALAIAARGVLVYLLARAGLALGAGLGLRSGFDRPALGGSVAGGAGLGGLLIGLDWVGSYLLAQPRFLPPLLGPPILVFLKGLYRSGCAALVEEVVFRLFLMTLFCRVLHRLRPIEESVLLAAILSGLLFGAAHLPDLAAVTTPTNILIIRTLTLNLIASLYFAWLYRRHGILQAMAAHCAMDVVLHAIGPFLLR